MRCKLQNASEITAFETVCILFNISIDANSVDPDQTVPIPSDQDLHCLLRRLLNVSADNKNIRLFVICALRVDTRRTCDVSVYTVRTFMKCTLFCAATKTLINFLPNYT